jgi:uncharacterized protein
MDRIADARALERVVGSRPAAGTLKSIDHLDPHCATLLAHSPLSVLGHPDAYGLRARVVGGTPGALAPAGDRRLAVPDEPGTPGPRALLTLVPGRSETLRVNGWAAEGGIAVDEAFLHCGKAVLRSGLWHPPASVAADGGGAGEGAPDATALGFLAAAPFAVVVSADAAGAADASPRGDPAGFLHLVGPATVAVPDRPGNRRTDTFHNVVERPAVALLALVPGDDRVLELSGTARLTADPGLLAPMAVQGRAPAAALLIDIERWWLAGSATLRAARAWDPDGHVPADRLPRPARVWADHVRRNGDPGLAARVARAAVSERLLGATVARDYRTRLY